MAQLLEMIFVIQILGVIGLFLAKFYNILTVGKFYDIKIAWIIFISFLICWLAGLVVFLNEPEEIFFLIFFRVETILLGLMGIFIIFEHFFAIKENANKVADQPRYSINEY